MAPKREKHSLSSLVVEARGPWMSPRDLTGWIPLECALQEASSGESMDSKGGCDAGEIGAAQFRLGKGQRSDSKQKAWAQRG